jgi:hypothetical protein
MQQQIQPLGAAQPAYSLPSILAIVCAIASFLAGAGWGLVLAVAAIVFGVIGVLLALLPNVRGGVTSFIAIIAGALGIVAAILKLAF